MRISTKGRYGLASMIYMAQIKSSEQYVTIISIAERLGISKIYLEQVFSLLKRAKLVESIKGAQGGYYLPMEPNKISVYDIMLAVEAGLFEKTEQSVSDDAKEIDSVMKTLVFETLDSAIADSLMRITLGELAGEADKLTSKDALMFYI